MSVTIFTKTTEVASAKVIDWLVYLNIDFVNISTIDFLNDKISISFSSLEKPKIHFNDTDISNTNKWTRKYVRTKTANYPTEFKDFIYDELKSFHISLISSLNKSGRILGTNDQYIDPLNVNKVHVLIAASELGISIPSTLISNDEFRIISFISRNNKSIVKPLSEPLIFFKDNKYHKTLTKLIKIDDPDIRNLTFPSYFQEYIEKEFEIRSFFVNDHFYSSAIFSQSNERTQVDFRNYDDNKPNRIVPYILEAELEKKLCKLMKKLHLNTGSIDLIYSTQGDIYFLEVNPTGQFSDIVDTCNYDAHFQIAKYLINHGR